jgi:23S rRNA (uracil1939-C5)-methyltransferase
MSFRSSKPTVLVDYLGPKGDGVAQGSRGPIYIERSAPLDKVQVKVSHDRMGVSRGEILTLIEPSPYRQEPPCPHFDLCGNCTLQHLTPEFYRHWKTRTVGEALLKVGLKPQKWLEPVFLKGHNRRRATFSVLKNRGKVVMGYYRRRSQEITEIKTCDIADPKLLELQQFLRSFIPILAPEGKPIDLFLQKMGNAFDLVISGPLESSSKAQHRLKSLLEELLSLSSIVRVSLKTEQGIQTLCQRADFIAEFGGLKVKLPPAAFLQPTQEGESALCTAVLNALPSRGKFADLFCGCGTFTGHMLNRGPVEAFESNSAAVRALSASHPGESLKVHQRDLFKNPLPQRDLNRFDAIVFDPPRAGCVEQAQQLARSTCKTLIGVSCNPATFARDAKWICQGGYRLKSVQVFDQFLWSHHVEIIGLFTK